jgi:hypothetical protein
VFRHVCKMGPEGIVSKRPPDETVNRLGVVPHSALVRADRAPVWLLEVCVAHFSIEVRWIMMALPWGQP